MSGTVSIGGSNEAPGATFGTHGCLFYETRQDLLNTLVPFFKTGLEQGESCLWIVSEPLTTDEAAQALRESVPDLDRYLSDQSIELASCGRPNDISCIIGLLHNKLAEALASGHSGLRVTRNNGALEQRDWQTIRDFENKVNNAIAAGPLTILCTYPIPATGAAELLEATHVHPVCATMRNGDWEFIETPELKEAKAGLKRLNQRLERKVVQGTHAMQVAQEELRNQKEVLEKIFDHIPVMINFMDPGGKIKLVNREWQRVVGKTLEEIREHNLDIVDIISECYPDPQGRKEVLDFISSSSGEWKELKARVRDGQMLDTVWAVLHLSDGSSIGFGRDITEQKQLEDRLRASAEELRALSASLQAALEEERTRVARTIHDELGSAFTSLKWDLESLDKTLSKPMDPAAAAALRAKIASMMKLADSTINTVRRIAWELRPRILDDLGLVDAIEWQARQFEARTGIICQRSGFLDGVVFDQEQATAIFRIFQEALTNILRHANATRVDITMTQEAGEFVLAISDNGRGIAGGEKSGLGILGMQERVRLVGGKIEILGLEGAGTTIAVRVPIAGEGTAPRTPAPEKE
ncbi:MAG: MEDS domain-containing protein [Bryobacteraceae bacterium]|jgi:PAS domain S-box-containing protein